MTSVEAQPINNSRLNDGIAVLNRDEIKTPITDEAAIGFARLLVDHGTPTDPKFVYRKRIYPLELGNIAETCKEAATALTAQAARIVELEGQVAERDKLFVSEVWIYRRRAEKAEAQRAEARAKYNELIMAVAKKFPGESRHETALRYINLAETPQVNTPQAETKRTEGGKDE